MRAWSPKLGTIYYHNIKQTDLSLFNQKKKKNDNNIYIYVIIHSSNTKFHILYEGILRKKK